MIDDKPTALGVGETGTRDDTKVVRTCVVDVRGQLSTVTVEVHSGSVPTAANLASGKPIGDSASAVVLVKAAPYDKLVAPAGRAVLRFRETHTLTCMIDDKPTAQPARGTIRLWCVPASTASAGSLHSKPAILIFGWASPAAGPPASGYTTNRELRPSRRLHGEPAQAWDQAG